MSFAKATFASDAGKTSSASNALYFAILMHNNVNIKFVRSARTDESQRT